MCVCWQLFPFSNQQRAVMHPTVLISLLTVTISPSTSSSSTTNQTLVTTITGFTKTNNADWSTGSTQQQRSVTPTGTSRASQTSTRIQEEHDTTVTGQTSKAFLSTILATSTIVKPPQKSTTQAPAEEFGEDDLRANPGLVAILTIFCIILVLVLIVATVKCIQSPSSDFERLEDVPMERINEGSPFARYSK
ncbi:uncharacterized homolog [Syngnathus scovelli]|uniref:uncharacterized homolog n=1 Tax=Syngnathus scovelli TaxID=161590 RepID=UPI00210F5592|nr:integumentary mucin C.1-like [Syngnathus scovelli]